ncbi:hypothetical protein [Picosynechococcus sp. PCC 8807]|uniref:hypothetical protein n=1 Tax=Picosynechococcus sp. PCC 8807 TaxID=195248 RepID=UPI0008109E4E|nr:hypothetical protein [Picosynechococcus sp. PCC 8807]ANV92068.1 hypothetical protein AWQ24_14925 [Picosynechococcus sp. PCC 8807]
MIALRVFQYCSDRHLERPVKRKGIKTLAAKRFSNAFTDFANGKSKKNPEELWAITSLDNPNGHGYLYQDLKL